MNTHTATHTTTNPLSVTHCDDGRGERIEASDDKMIVSLAQRAAEDPTEPGATMEWLSVDVHLNTDCDIRASQLDFSGNIAVGTCHATMYVSADQAVEMVGAILKALPTEMTEAFVDALTKG